MRLSMFSRAIPFRKLNLLLLAFMGIAFIMTGCPDVAGTISTPAPNATASPTPAPVLVSSIDLSGNSSQMSGFESDYMTLNATIVPENASNKTIMWSSSNENVATVNASGKVTCVSTVTADTSVTITASSTDGSSVSETITLTIKHVDLSQAVTVQRSNGWLESALIEWTALEDAGSYDVYYQKDGSADWTKIDTQLIRNYPNYVRADILGLSAGDYTLKVTARSSGGTEFTGSSIATATVLPHDRTGFAFVGTTTPGAYKVDGTLKDNAVVLYITENNKNTVSMDVSGATTNPCVGLQTILDGYKKGSETRPLAVRFIGNITDFALMNKGDLVIENDNGTTGITFEGVGNDAVANGWGIRIKNSSYIEIRNIATMNCDSDEGDNIGLQQDNSHIWIHHNDFFYGHAGSDGDQAKGDGALDTKKSNFITMSYNHFWDTGKSNLVGLSEGIKSYETDALYVTFHHNWYDHADSRHPRVRFYNAHVYNNYFDGIAKYGAGSTLGSSVFMENNYFRNANRPMMISMQGTDVYSTGTVRDVVNNPTFSKEDGGIIKAYGNVMEGDNTFIPYGATNILTSGTWAAASARSIDTNADFDAYVVDAASETVPDTIRSYQGNNYYSNFDTGGTTQAMYSWTPESAEDAVDTVMQYAGRIEGGDFKWTFNNSVDDTSYVVNTALKTALTSYTTSLVSIQGDTTSSGDTGDGGDIGDGGDTGGGELPEGTVVVTFESYTSATTINGVAVEGSLKSGAASKTYDGVTYTKALKVDSAGKARFTATANGTLTLVTGSATVTFKINTLAQSPNAEGIITYSISTGTEYLIEKGSGEGLLYAIIITPDV